MKVVLEAQAVLAYFQGEEGSDAVERLLHGVAAGIQEAWINVVNLAEVRYILLRRSAGKADELVEWLLQLGVRVASVDDTWRRAADIKAQHGISLADCFALATATQHDAVLMAGNDPEFDVAPQLGVKIQRIATGKE